LIEPYYPDPVGRGRRPIELKKMLKIYFLQQWYNLSDPGMEEALHDSYAMQRFVGIDLGREAPPDETTILKFRHLLEEHNIGEELFAEVNRYLREHGITVKSGTIMDATIVSAPTSMKNMEQKRDSEMSSTKKGSRWYFGFKAHIGVDSSNQLIHSVSVTTASVHDSQEISKLLHGGETEVYGDKAYSGKTEEIRHRSIKAKDLILQKSYRNRPLSECEKRLNRIKNSVRSLVEYSFLVMKKIFGFEKTRYRGLHKNENKIYTMMALVNLYIQRKRLVAVMG
jgi:IS5 family transposase